MNGLDNDITQAARHGLVHGIKQLSGMTRFMTLHGQPGSTCFMMSYRLPGPALFRTLAFPIVLHGKEAQRLQHHKHKAGRHRGAVVAEETYLGRSWAGRGSARRWARRCSRCRCFRGCCCGCWGGCRHCCRCWKGKSSGDASRRVHGAQHATSLHCPYSTATVLLHCSILPVPHHRLPPAKANTNCSPR